MLPLTFLTIHTYFNTSYPYNIYVYMSLQIIILMWNSLPINKHVECLQISHDLTPNVLYRNHTCLHLFWSHPSFSITLFHSMLHCTTLSFSTFSFCLLFTRLCFLSQSNCCVDGKFGFVFYHILSILAQLSVFWFLMYFLYSRIKQ